MDTWTVWTRNAVFYSMRALVRGYRGTVQTVQTVQLSKEGHRRPLTPTPPRHPTATARGLSWGFWRPL